MKKNKIFEKKCFKKEKTFSVLQMKNKFMKKEKEDFVCFCLENYPLQTTTES